MVGLRQPYPKTSEDASVADFLLMPVTTIDEINYLWGIINQAFTAAASHHIPNELRISELDISPKKFIDFRPPRALCAATEFRLLINKYRLNPSVDVSSAAILNDNNTIAKWNDAFNLNCPLIDSSDISQWITSAKFWWKRLESFISSQERIKRDTTIRKNIDKRASYTITNQRRMLSSILERSSRSIVIDRLLVTDDDNNEVLLVNPDDILAAAPKQYQVL